MNSDCKNNIKSSSRYYHSKLNYVYTSRQCDEYLNYLEELRRIIFGRNYKSSSSETMSTEVQSTSSIRYHVPNGRTLVYKLENASEYGIKLSPVPSDAETVRVETVDHEVLPKPEECHPLPQKLCHRIPAQIEERMQGCLHSSAEIISGSFYDQYLTEEEANGSRKTPETFRFSNIHLNYKYQPISISSSESSVYSEDVLNYQEEARSLADAVNDDFAVKEDFATVVEDSESVFNEMEDSTEDMNEFVVSHEEVTEAVNKTTSTRNEPREKSGLFNETVYFEPMSFSERIEIKTFAVSSDDSTSQNGNTKATSRNSRLDKDVTLFTGPAIPEHLLNPVPAVVPLTETASNETPTGTVSTVCSEQPKLFLEAEVDETRSSPSIHDVQPTGAVSDSGSPTLTSPSEPSSPCVHTETIKKFHSSQDLVESIDDPSVSPQANQNVPLEEMVLDYVRLVINARSEIIPSTQQRGEDEEAIQDSVRNTLAPHDFHMMKALEDDNEEEQTERVSDEGPRLCEEVETTEVREVSEVETAPERRVAFPLKLPSRKEREDVSEPNTSDHSVVKGEHISYAPEADEDYFERPFSPFTLRSLSSCYDKPDQLMFYNYVSNTFEDMSPTPILPTDQAVENYDHAIQKVQSGEVSESHSLVSVHQKQECCNEPEMRIMNDGKPTYRDCVNPLSTSRETSMFLLTAQSFENASDFEIDDPSEESVDLQVLNTDDLLEIDIVPTIDIAENLDAEEFILIPRKEFATRETAREFEVEQPDTTDRTDNPLERELPEKNSSLKCEENKEAFRPTSDAVDAGKQVVDAVFKTVLSRKNSRPKSSSDFPVGTDTPLPLGRSTGIFEMNGMPSKDGEKEESTSIEETDNRFADSSVENSHQLKLCDDLTESEDSIQQDKLAADTHSPSPQSCAHRTGENDAESFLYENAEENAQGADFELIAEELLRKKEVAIEVLEIESKKCTSLLHDSQFSNEVVSVGTPSNSTDNFNETSVSLELRALIQTMVDAVCSEFFTVLTAASEVENGWTSHEHDSEVDSLEEQSRPPTALHFPYRTLNCSAPDSAELTETYSQTGIEHDVLPDTLVEDQAVRENTTSDSRTPEQEIAVSINMKISDCNHSEVSSIGLCLTDNICERGTSPEPISTDSAMHRHIINTSRVVDSESKATMFSEEELARPKATVHFADEEVNDALSETVETSIDDFPIAEQKDHMEADLLVSFQTTHSDSSDSVSSSTGAEKQKAEVSFENTNSTTTYRSSDDILKNVSSKSVPNQKLISDGNQMNSKTEVIVNQEEERVNHTIDLHCSETEANQNTSESIEKSAGICEDVDETVPLDSLIVLNSHVLQLEKPEAAETSVEDNPLSAIGQRCSNSTEDFSETSSVASFVLRELIEDLLGTTPDYETTQNFAVNQETLTGYNSELTDIEDHKKVDSEGEEVSRPETALQFPQKDLHVADDDFQPEQYSNVDDSAEVRTESTWEVNFEDSRQQSHIEERFSSFDISETEKESPVRQTHVIFSGDKLRCDSSSNTINFGNVEFKPVEKVVTFSVSELEHGDEKSGIGSTGERTEDLEEEEGKAASLKIEAEAELHSTECLLEPSTAELKTMETTEDQLVTKSPPVNQGSDGMTTQNLNDTSSSNSDSTDVASITRSHAMTFKIHFVGEETELLTSDLEASESGEETTVFARQSVDEYTSEPPQLPKVCPASGIADCVEEHTDVGEVCSESMIGSDVSDIPEHTQTSITLPRTDGNEVCSRDVLDAYVSELVETIFDFLEDRAIQRPDVHDFYFQDVVENTPVLEDYSPTEVLLENSYNMAVDKDGDCLESVLTEISPVPQETLETSRNSLTSLDTGITAVCNTIDDLIVEKPEERLVACFIPVIDLTSSEQDQTECIEFENDVGITNKREEASTPDEENEPDISNGVESMSPSNSLLIKPTVENFCAEPKKCEQLERNLELTLPQQAGVSQMCSSAMIFEESGSLVNVTTLPLEADDSSEYYGAEMLADEPEEVQSGVRRFMEDSRVCVGKKHSHLEQNELIPNSIRNRVDNDSDSSSITRVNDVNLQEVEEVCAALMEQTSEEYANHAEYENNRNDITDCLQSENNIDETPVSFEDITSDVLDINENHDIVHRNDVLENDKSVHQLRPYTDSLEHTPFFSATPDVGSSNSQNFFESGFRFTPLSALSPIQEIGDESVFQSPVPGESCIESFPIAKLLEIPECVPVHQPLTEKEVASADVLLPSSLHKISESESNPDSTSDLTGTNDAQNTRIAHFNDSSSNCAESVPTNAFCEETLLVSTETTLSPSENSGTSSVVEEVSYFLTTVCVAALAFVAPTSESSSFNSDIIEDASKYFSNQPEPEDHTKT